MMLMTRAFAAYKTTSTTVCHRPNEETPGSELLVTSCQGRLDVLSRHLQMAPAGLKGTSVHRHGKSRAAIVAAATAAGMAAGGVLVADGPKDA